MKKKWLGSFLTIGVLALSLLAGCSSNKETASTPEQTSAFPTKAITIVNASAPGSPTDIMARAAAHYMKDDLGVPVVVVNADGAGGANMMAKIKAEPADGYTIATANAAQITNTYDKITQHSIDDFDFLVNVQEEPYAIVVMKDSPIKTFEDIMKLGQEGKLRIGGQLNILSSMLEGITVEKYGFELPYTPFSGGSESVTNLLGGNVEVISSSPTSVQQYTQDGTMRIIAITGTKRMESEELKDVPTLLELGYEKTEPTSYRGFIARKGIPQDVKDKLVDSITKALNQPDINIEVTGYMGPEEFTEYAKKGFDSYVDIMSRSKN